MHSLVPYTLRVTNPGVPVSSENKKQSLGRVGSHDTLDIFLNFINSRGENFTVLEEKKQIYKFTKFNFFPDAEKENEKPEATKERQSKEKKDREEEVRNSRVIYGWFQLGTYGTVADIINVKSKKVDYTKTLNNAEIVNYFVYMYLPEELDEGIVLLHSVGGSGVKTLLLDTLTADFRITTGCGLQMNSLTYKKAFDEWSEALTKEILFVQFEGFSDITDSLEELGHDEKTLSIKAPRKGYMGKFKDYMNKDSDQSKAIEVISSQCREVKTVVELNGKKRTFKIGSNTSNKVCEIQADDDLKLHNGNPTYNAMKEWCTDICNEFYKALYPVSGDGQ